MTASPCRASDALRLAGSIQFASAKPRSLGLAEPRLEPLVRTSPTSARDDVYLSARTPTQTGRMFSNAKSISALKELDKLLSPKAGQKHPSSDEKLRSSPRSRCESLDALSDAATDSTEGPPALDDLELLSEATGSVNTSCTSSARTSTMSSACTSVSGFYTTNGECGRYTPRKIHSWFHNSLDMGGAGQLNFRQFLAALRQNVGLQEALSQAVGLPMEVAESKLCERMHGVGPVGLSVQERTDGLLRERQRIKTIYEEISGGAAGGVLEYATFLAFFKRQGLLLGIDEEKFSPTK